MQMDPDARLGTNLQKKKLDIFSVAFMISVLINFSILPYFFHYSHFLTNIQTLFLSLILAFKEQLLDLL